MVIHGLRVVQARGVGTLADTTERLGGDNGLLVAATDLLRGGGEDDTGCCVRLELADLDEAAPDDAEAADGSPLFTADLIGGQKQLNRIHAALAARGQTAFYARSLLGPNRAGTLLGQADAATGTMVLEHAAGPSTWAHELGHLQGLGHYATAARAAQVMYKYGEVADQQGLVSCRDCDYFRASAPGRRTFDTIVSHQRCSLAEFAGESEIPARNPRNDADPTDRTTPIGCSLTRGATTWPAAPAALLLAAVVLLLWARCRASLLRRQARADAAGSVLAACGSPVDRQASRPSAAVAFVAVLVLHSGVACTEDPVQRRIEIQGRPAADDSDAGRRPFCPADAAPLQGESCDNLRHSRATIDQYDLPSPYPFGATPAQADLPGEHRLEIYAAPTDWRVCRDGYQLECAVDYCPYPICCDSQTGESLRPS